MPTPSGTPTAICVLQLPAPMFSLTSKSEEQDRPRLVVINDDTPFLELMEALLEGEEGYEVHVRKEWLHAYEFVKEQHPDLVILDIVMGREERGWGILNLLTLDPETHDIPVIVCSAAVQSLQQHAAMLQRHGIRALPKPFDLEELLTAVKEMLANASRRPKDT
jgi:CheY-like chemotaxis protein